MDQATNEVIQTYRARIRSGEQLTIEELRAALTTLRQGREAAAKTSSKARTAKTAAKKEVDSEGLLNELDGL